MADLETQLIAKERLLDRTREKAKKDQDRLERQNRKLRKELADALTKIERYERDLALVHQIEKGEIRWAGN